MFSPCVRGFSPASSHQSKSLHVRSSGEGRPRRNKAEQRMLFSLGWRVAYERENSDKKTNAEDGRTGPLARNGSTAQLRHGDERHNNFLNDEYNHLPRMNV